MNNKSLVNIYNDKRKIYLFCRDKNGKLFIEEDNSFFPYFFELDPEGQFKAYTGESLRKIFVSNPRDIPKQRSINAMGADIPFCKQYLIDKIDKLEKCSIKFSFIDIEVICDELPDVKKADKPISCISVYNSFNKEIKTFWIKNYKTEYELMKDFVNYMKKEQFDLILGWNLVKFDYPYLCARFSNFAEKISPIEQSRYGDGEVFYPAGISIIDFLIWDKKVTLNRRKSYALDEVIKEEFNVERTKVDFSKLSEELKKKNIEDVGYLAKLEGKKHYIDYFDEIRRLSKVEWEDMFWVSRVHDMLLLQEAKNQHVVLSMKPSEERGTLEEKTEYEGAYREVFKTGRFENIGVYDLTSAYPSMIINFALDPANAYNAVHKDSPCIKIGDTYFNQNYRALLPTIVKKLLVLKEEIKQKMNTLSVNSQEYKDTKQTYSAIKGIVNSAYGIYGNRFFRLYSPKVASATTYLVRDLLYYVQDKLEKQGHEIIYLDTDSVMLNNNKEDLSNLLNKHIKEWAKIKYGKENPTTEFSYEGTFKNIVILTLCRYEGELLKPNGEIELKRVGLEIRRKDSTVFMKKFQAALLKKIRYKEPKENIIAWIKEEIKNLPNQPLQEIAFPCKLGRPIENYKNTPIFVRALQNTPNFKKKVGELFYYIFIKPEENNKIKTLIKIKTTTDISYKNILLDTDLSRKEGIEYARKEFNEPDLDSKNISVLHIKDKPKDVIAFDETTIEQIKDKVDYSRMIDRNILMKLDVIFSAMKWDIKEVNPNHIGRMEIKSDKETKDKID